MADRLTDVSIRNLPSMPSGQYDVWDSAVTGLGVRVNTGGSKSFVLIYRLGTRPRRMTLGRYPSLKLKAARQTALDHQHTIRNGGDPAEEKKKQRLNSLAFNEYVKTFIDTYAKPRNRTWKETETILNREFVSKWRKRDIRKIAKADVTHILDELVGRNKITSANRAFAQIRKLFNWAVERGDLENSPCQGLKSPGKYNSRERVLSDAETVAVWNAADKMGYPFGAVIKLLFLTGQRLNDVASLRWSEIDLNEKTWTLPADRNKSTREHIIPLSPQAVEACLSA
jgi:integrase